MAAVAKVASPVGTFRRPVQIAVRDFVCGCDLEIGAVLPERTGVPVRGLLDRLSFVRRKDVWGQYFRSGLIRVPAEDFAAMADAVRDACGRKAEACRETREIGHPG